MTDIRTGARTGPVPDLRADPAPVPAAGPSREDLTFRLYPYARSPEQDAPARRHPVVVVGAGPTGLAAALDLARHGVPTLVLDDNEGVGEGSRAICFSKRSLEICDRLGAGRAMLEKGVVWNRGKVFHDDRLLYEFDLLPESGHHFPAFVNLQQTWFEKYLIDAIKAAREVGAPIEIRGANRVTALTQNPDRVALTVDTPEGPYPIEARWLIAADGARSPLRTMLGLAFEGRVFEDNFLIADVRMKADFPTERWFWFEPWFRSSASALLHKQPDDIWRMDFQLGWNIDRETELEAENVRARVSAMLGPDTPYDLVWTSIYTFQCRRMARFRHGRVLFAGDAAHQVSPFGARGANSGLQDTDNLAWKLDLVLSGLAPEALLDSYEAERIPAADENLVASTRTTDFITPKSPASRLFRNAVLDLAETLPFARTLVNSGRLSVPASYDNSPLNSPDTASLPERTRPGSPAPDAPVPGGWLLEGLGHDFMLLAIDTDIPTTFPAHGLTLPTIALTAKDNSALGSRYLGEAPSAVYLIRPDQHVAARWPAFDATAVAQALARALAKETN